MHYKFFVSKMADRMAEKLPITEIFENETKSSMHSCVGLLFVVVVFIVTSAAFGKY